MPQVQTKLTDYFPGHTNRVNKAEQRQRPRKFTPTIQLTLERFVSGIRRHPCPIQRVPPEIIMEIISYLPFVKARSRIHCDVFTLPYNLQTDYDADEKTNDDPKVRIEDSSCIADQLTQGGCERFCTATKTWKCYTILRVCKTWREIAVSTPAFWCRVPLHDPTWTTRALERSKNSPIYAAGAFVHTETSASAIAAVLTQLHRVRELYVPLDICPSESIVGALSLGRAPQLQTLRIGNTGLSEDAWKAVPDNLFCNESPPLLCAVTLESCNSVPPTSVVFASTLTRLCILFSEDIWTSAEDMLATLSRMPLLEELDIQFGIPFPCLMGDYRSDPNGERLCMHSLRKLTLLSNNMMITNFLDFLRFPRSTVFWITYNYEDELDFWDEILLDRSADFFYHQFSHDSTNSVSFSRSDLFVDYEEEELQLRFYGNLDGAGTTLLLSLQRINISHADLINLAESIKSTLTVLPYEQITGFEIIQLSELDDMELKTPSDVDEDLWWHCFRDMDNLRHLRLHCQATIFVVNWLYLESPGSICFPNLEDIALVCWNLSYTIPTLSPERLNHTALRSLSSSPSSSCTTSGSSYATSCSETDFGFFSAVHIIAWHLQQRAEGFSTLYKLILKDCDVDEEDLIYLEDTCGNNMVDIVSECKKGTW